MSTAPRPLSEEQLQRLLAVQGFTALGETVAGITHDLNNPLAGVLGFSQLLINRPGLDPGVRQDAEQIARETKRLGLLVDSLHRFVTSQRSDPGTQDLNDLVARTTDLKLADLRHNEIGLELELDPETPLVYGRRFDLQVALLNLLANAQQALAGTGGGQVVVATGPAGPGRIQLTVTDNGPGFPAGQAEELFAPFAVGPHAGGGPGLGLTVSRSIVETHQGTLQVAAAPKGARLVIELPLWTPGQ